MKKESLNFLKKLAASISPSGYEREAADILRKEAAAFSDDIRTDCHGNTDIVIHPGGAPRIMLAGHCDEIGFIVTHIDDKGFLWMAPIGGWDSQIPQGHRVVIRGRKGHVPGVIGKCPIHLLKEENRKSVTQISDLWVDLGVRNKKEAEKLVAIGDPLVLDHELQVLQGDRVAARGLDNRAGAFVVLDAARRLSGMNIRAEVHAVATVQEEIGLRGARTSAFGIDPAVGIAVDVTFATDHPSMGDIVKREGQVNVGKGPVLTRGANINGRLFELCSRVAKTNRMRIQIVAEPNGTGTDANIIQLSRGGVATALISVPTRYLHSSCELLSLGDLEACGKLLALTVAEIGPDTNLIPF